MVRRGLAPKNFRKVVVLIGSSLTTRAIYALGVVLILVGLYFVLNGVPVVRMEIGPAEIIGGAVTACAGWLVLTMGLVLSRLESLLERRPVADEVPVAADGGEVVAREPRRRRPILHPLSPAGRRQRADAVDTTVRPEPALAIPAIEEEPAPAPMVDPPEAPAITEGAPALVHAEEEQSHSPPVEALDPLVVAEPPKPRSTLLASFLARRNLPVPPWRETKAEPAPPVDEPFVPPVADPVSGSPLRRSVIDLSSGWDEEPAAAPPPAPVHHDEHPAPAEPGREPEAVPAASHHEVAEPVPEPVPVEPPTAPPEPEAVEAVPEHVPEPHPVPEPHHAPEPQPAHVEEPVAAAEPASSDPVVVGRYNAGSASYVMYSNGMIEVETEQGTHQFASMQELKAFIERRDPARAY